ncbi:MAG: hypothetical protein KDB80_15390 [Planctomycetes bacterium]|nr:hypothetical protein [Planctomycetota bacterium]
MTKSAKLLPFCLCFGVALGAQDSKPTSRPAAPQDPAALLRTLEENGVHVDPKAHTVTIECEMGRPVDALEYVLIHRKGKTHEALVVTDVVPSLLNAGLLAIGLERGNNARVEEIEPAPTLEEVQAGAEWMRVYPAEGKSMWMTLTWEDDGEKHVDVPVEALLLDLTTGETLRDNRWVFLGGNMAPLLRGEDPVFMADYQGNIVSSCYMYPNNHLVTVVHERANSDDNWWLVQDLCPPPGTKMKMTFHRDKPDSVVARESALAKDAERKAAEPAQDEPPQDR